MFTLFSLSRLTALRLFAVHTAARSVIDIGHAHPSGCSGCCRLDVTGHRESPAYMYQFVAVVPCVRFNGDLYKAINDDRHCKRKPSRLYLFE